MAANPSELARLIVIRSAELESAGRRGSLGALPGGCGGCAVHSRISRGDYAPGLPAVDAQSDNPLAGAVE
jgi:hypothetical protein